MLSAEQLCPYLIRLIHTPIRVYDPSGTQIAIYADHGEQQDIFACDEAFLKMLLALQDEACPYLYLEAEQIAYGIVGDGTACYLIGPCCVGGDDVLAARYLVSKHGLDKKTPYRVHRAALLAFADVLRMLFECLTGQSVSMTVLFTHSFCNDRFEQELRKKVTDVFYCIRESGTVHNPYTQELMEQESIRRGDPDMLRRSLAVQYVGKYGTMADDGVRQAKNMDIVVIALACRSAIQGGLLPEVAFSMSDAFIQCAEEMSNVGEILALGRQAEMEYCLAVRALSESKTLNPVILRCKELISQRLHTKLSVVELARELELNPSYLSQLFTKEEGIRLTDYIAQEKVALAKEQLAYTERPYDEIAHTLGFATQSHFGQVFKKWAGMTPKQYREECSGQRFSQQN